MLEKINLTEKLARFQDLWSPKLIADVNGQSLKLAKLQGEFVRHRHAQADELFFVLSGRLRIRVSEETGEHEIVLDPGDLLVVPAGIEHLPIADVETHVLLLEPLATLNTGDVRDERTAERLERI